MKENWFLQIMIYSGQNHEQILKEKEVERTRGDSVLGPAHSDCGEHEGMELRNEERILVAF